MKARKNSQRSTMSFAATRVPGPPAEAESNNSTIGRSKTYSGRKIKLVKQRERSPWSAPPNKRFPRNHLWSWDEDGSNETSFEEEFEKATSLQLTQDNPKTKQRETSNGIAGGGQSLADSLLGSKRTNKKKGRSGSKSSQTGFENTTPAMARNIADSNGINNNANDDSSEFSNENRKHLKHQFHKKLKIVPGGNGRRTSLSFTAAIECSSLTNNKGDEETKQDHEGDEKEKKEGGGDEEEGGKEGKEEGNQQDAQYFNYQTMPTPTPPLVVFGFNEDEVDSDEELDQLLLKKEKKEKEQRSTLETFVNACVDTNLLPEPLLNSRRQESKETMEASKMHVDLNIKNKADIEKLNSRETILLDWETVSKIRTPDELKLEHYGLGDRYMKAMSKGLEKDASNSQKGKRSFVRFNLSACRISGKGLGDFLKGFSIHSKASKLDLSNNLLGPSGIGSLSEMFFSKAPVCKSLCVLDLHGNGLGDRAIVQLFEALKVCSIEWLNLNKNQIGANGALAIANFAATQRHQAQLNNGGRNSHFPSYQCESEDSDGEEEQEDETQIHFSKLKTLLLDWNKIRGAEACHLLRSFENNQVIKELSLSWNGFGAHEESSNSVINLISKNISLKRLCLAHNLFKAKTCGEILETMLESKSLLSVDLSGNEQHENIFLRNEQKDTLHSLSEKWSLEENDLCGTLFVYTRYSVRQSRRQRKLSTMNSTKGAFATAMPTFKLNESKSEKSKTDSSEPNQRKKAQSITQAEQNDPNYLDDCADSNLWKRRGVCWLKQRWTKHTIWYYPGISGPPSRDVFVVFMLPGGAAMCAKMRMAPDMQPSMNMKRSRAKKRTGTVATSGQKSHGVNKQTTMMMKGSKQSTKLLFNTKRGTSKALVNSKGLKSGLIGNRNNLGKLHESIGEDSEGIDEEAESAVIFDPLGVRKRKLRQFSEKKDKKNMSQGYNYQKLLTSAEGDKNSMLGSVILESIKKQVEKEYAEEEPESIANLKDLSLHKTEPICPCYVTVMLPPGRTHFKFVVRGQEIFARDRDTCWTKWPTEEGECLNLDSNEESGKGDSFLFDPHGSRSGSKQKEATDLQQLPSVVNCIDIKWPLQPVGSLADPDPGSERPQPATNWSVKRSMFRYHHCDSMKTLKEAFVSDWEKVEDNTYLIKAVGEELETVRELIWANYSDICTAFTYQACLGDGNIFAMSFEELSSWIETKEIVPESVERELLRELYDQSVLIEMRSATNAFGKHYNFMCKASLNDANKETCTMFRHQFLQFLILLAVKVFAPNSRPSISRANAHSRGSRVVTKVKTKSKYGTEAFETPFEAVHHLLCQMLKGREAEYVHRDVFRRGHLFFQDIVNVFLRNIEFLRDLFDKYSVKGHVLHDFIPALAWEEMFSKIDAGYAVQPLRRIFALSKNTFVDFEDVDFAPGLCFLEFLECLARLARLEVLADTVLSAFETKSQKLKRKGKRKKMKGVSDNEDGLAEHLELLIQSLKTKGLR